MELIALDLMQQFMRNEIPSYNFLIQTRPCSKKIIFEIRVFKRREITLVNTFHTMLQRYKCMKLEKVSFHLENQWDVSSFDIPKN